MGRSVFIPILTFPLRGGRDAGRLVFTLTLALSHQGRGEE